MFERCQKYSWLLYQGCIYWRDFKITVGGSIRAAYVGEISKVYLDALSGLHMLERLQKYSRLLYQGCICWRDVKSIVGCSIRAAYVGEMSKV
jgi:hypothetical protein